MTATPQFATIIESGHYERTRAALRQDPIVQSMYDGPFGIKNLPLTAFAHDDGTPRMSFMTGANAEYQSRGGKVIRLHIGAVAEVLIEKLQQDNS